MAHSLSSKKRIRQNEKRRMRNRARVGAMRTQIKKYVGMSNHPDDLGKLEQELRNTQKTIDKLVAKGTIHKNTAARKKAQLARMLNDAKAKAAS